MTPVASPPEMSSPPTAPARAPSRPGAAERLAEYFTLRGAAAELSRLDETVRVEIADGIALARQQMAAAEALFAVGHTVEALRLGTESLRHTERAAERYAAGLGLAPPASLESPSEAAGVEGAPSTPAAAWELLAARAGVSDARVRSAARAIAELDKRAVPALEKDVSPAHVEAFRELVRARADVEEGILPATLTKESLAGTRWFRIVGTTLVSLAALVGLYFFLRPVEGTFVDRKSVV